MGNPTNYLIFNASGAGVGEGYSPDGTAPVVRAGLSAVIATADQAAAWQQATLVSGAIVIGSAPSPSAAQVAKAAYAAWIAGGLTITSTGTPALSGVYAIDPASQVDIATEAQFISTFSEFTNGTTADLEWTLASGSPVTFPTTVEFMAFAKASAQAVAAAKLALVQAAAMPSATVTIV